MLKIVGICLIVLGIFMIAYTSFNFVTTKRVVDIGPIQIDKKENHPVQWPPIAGVVLLVGGIAVIIFDKKGNRST